MLAAMHVISIAATLPAHANGIVLLGQGIGCLGQGIACDAEFLNTADAFAYQQ